MAHEHIRLITRRDIIRSVPNIWLQQYASYAADRVLSAGRTVGEIRAALRALNTEVCSVADVDAAIGATGWTELRCDGCNADCDYIVRIGDEPDYEQRWQDLCGACLDKARAILAEVAP